MYTEYQSFCSKYVFQFNFAPITGPDSFIFFLKLKIVGPYWTETLVLYIYVSPTLPPFTHMYSEEPSLRRLKCTHVETGQRSLAPSPRCIIPYFLHPWLYLHCVRLRLQLLSQKLSLTNCRTNVSAKARNNAHTVRSILHVGTLVK